MTEPSLAASRAPGYVAEASERRRWMAVLARARIEELELAWSTLPAPPKPHWLRKPEIGLAMLRARAGGTGAQFNLGEASVTRCTLRIPSGHVGIAYVLGRNHRHVELAAVFDALLQDAVHHASLERSLIKPLIAAQAARRNLVATKAAATQVDFFTMVRGEDDGTRVNAS